MSGPGRSHCLVSSVFQCRTPCSSSSVLCHLWSALVSASEMLTIVMLALWLWKAAALVPSYTHTHKRCFEAFKFLLAAVSVWQQTFLVLIFSLSATDNEVIYRSFDGDILKFNTHSNETELLMKNTTFVRFLFRYLCFGGRRKLLFNMRAMIKMLIYCEPILQ